MSNANTSSTDNGKSVKAKVKDAAGSAAEGLKARSQDAADTVASEAAGYANQAKGTAADEMKGVASALRTAADELRSGSPQERTFSQIADGLADASEAVRDQDLSEMVSSVTGFARRNPLVFLGSAALIGFAATRFAKASSDGASSAQGARSAAGYSDHSARNAPSSRSHFSPATGPTTGPTTAGGQNEY